MKDRNKATDTHALAEAFFNSLEIDDCEYGGIGLDSKRPFGNSDVDGDILEIIGASPESYVKINGPRTGKSGAFNGRSKISESDVLAIRSDRRSQSIIAFEYGITQTTVSGIKLRKLWAHIS